MIGGKNIEDATLNPSQQHGSISPTSAQRYSKNKAVDSEHSILDLLIQQLLESGIDGVWRYSEACGLQRSEVNYTAADRIRVAVQWNLVVDAKYGKGIARDWGKALEVAVQRGQEGSIRLLLENEAVVLSKISSFCGKFENIGEEDEWNFGLHQPQRPHGQILDGSCWETELEWKGTRD
jgi:hypothetical protein